VDIDCRKLIFYPRLAANWLTSPCELARDVASSIHVVAAREAGIPYAAGSPSARLPMQYVRKKPKASANAQIEAHPRGGAHAAGRGPHPDGRSKINFCKAVRERARSSSSVRQLLLRHLPESKKTLADLTCACIISPRGGRAGAGKKGATSEAGGRSAKSRSFCTRRRSVAAHAGSPLSIV